MAVMSVKSRAESLMRVGVSGIHAAGMSEVAYGMGRRQSGKARRGRQARPPAGMPSPGECRPDAGSRWDAREG